MKTFLTTLSALLASIAIAYSADVPTKANPPKTTAQPSFNWTGFYVGGNVGYGRQNSSTTQSNSGVFAGLFPANSGAVQSGIQAGAQLGYRRQFGQIVAGLDVDFDWLDRKASNSASAAIAGLATNTATSSSIKWVSTVAGIVGFAIPSMPNLMIYGRGGYAFGDTSISQSSALTGCVVGCGAASDSSVRSGWTLGGGAEFAFARNWSVKAEYRHVDLGSGSVAYRGSGPAAVAPAFSASTRFRDDAVLVGVNYKISE